MSGSRVLEAFEVTVISRDVHAIVPFGRAARQLESRAIAKDDGHRELDGGFVRDEQLAVRIVLGRVAAQDIHQFRIERRI